MDDQGPVVSTRTITPPLAECARSGPRAIPQSGGKDTQSRRQRRTAQFNAVLPSGGQTHRRRRKHAPARHIHNLNRHEGRQGKIKHQTSGLPKGIGIVAAHCERCRQCLRANVAGVSDSYKGYAPLVRKAKLTRLILMPICCRFTAGGWLALRPLVGASRWLRRTTRR